MTDRYTKAIELQHELIQVNNESKQDPQLVNKKFDELMDFLFENFDVVDSAAVRAECKERIIIPGGGGVNTLNLDDLKSLSESLVTIAITKSLITYRNDLGERIPLSTLISKSFDTFADRYKDIIMS